MSRRTSFGITFALLFCVIGVLVWVGSFPDSGHPTDAASPVGGQGNSVTTRTGSGGEDNTTDPGVVRDLVSELAAWRSLYDNRGWLSQDETKALAAERKAAAAVLAAKIGASGPGIVPEVRGAIRNAPGSREKLTLMDGLGENPSAEAVDALEDIYAEEELARIKEEALRQLGNSDGEGHNDMLIEEMLNGDDPAMAQTAAAMLYGEAEAMDALVECIYGEQSVEIRLEAVHSVGGVGSDEAQEALEGVTQSELEERVQVYAEREIERSFE